MEDKWFIFYENDWLYFHRSWTGYCIYKLRITKESNEKFYTVKEFWAEREKARYGNSNDQQDIDNIHFLIARGLLGMDIRQFYASKHLQNETDAISAWSNFGHLLYTNPETNYSDKIRAAIFGLAIGDALGVPVEFKSRQTISRNPVTDMIGYGTYNLPPGTWSDDSSLTFCLSEALTTDFDLHNVGQNFIAWLYKNYWTPHGTVFDVGITTQQAIKRLANGERADLAGEFDEFSNGNGSLMRILPLLFYIQDKPIADRYELTKQVSSITHGHIRSVVSCFYYLEFARLLLTRSDKFVIYEDLKTSVTDFLHQNSINPTEIDKFDRLLRQDIYKLKEIEIKSSGYVVHTLEASIWCLLTTENYKDAVLKAVNLGEDTDTTGSVTGGLAGLLYGFDSIPDSWIKQLTRRQDIENLVQRLNARFSNLTKL